MSFLDLSNENLDDAKEPKCVDEGEYTLSITDWKTDEEGKVEKRDLNDNPFIMPVLEVIECEEAEYAKPITHFLRLPYPEMSKKDRNDAQWNLKCFFDAFEIDYTQRLDFDETLGKTCEALLTVQPDTGYGEQNRVQRFINPR